MQQSFKEMIIGWLSLSRPSFHLVGITPFVLGTFLAYKLAAKFNPEVFIFGISGVILIMLSTYHAGEFFDRKGDFISGRLHQNRFAGGSRVFAGEKIAPGVALWTSIISLILAAFTGIALQFILETGKFTLLLGCLGAFCGFFYSAEPIRLVKRGLGEIFIGFCYGWLPVASGYYIQTGTIHPLVYRFAIPIGLSIFNVILLNEFPDYEADAATNKRNLLYRLGRQKGMMLSASLSLLTIIAMLVSPLWGIPWKVVYFFGPFALISLSIATMMFRGKYKNVKLLEILCGLNIAVNLGTSLAFIGAYI
jgi:1,4-dihydroxy-2-naphthoate polyprenyltransferase